MTMHRQWFSPGRRALALGAVASMAGGAALASTVAAQANSLLAVTSTADVADATPGDATCDTPALSAAAGACTFRAAAQTAQNLSGTTTIQLPAGTITLKLGEIPIASNVIIVGQGIAQTTIDAAKKSRVLDTDCTGRAAHTVAINNLTLQNGDATKAGPFSGIGGGIITCGTVLSLNSVLVQKNHAGFGGGVATYAPLTVTGSTFHLNSAAVGVQGLIGGGGVAAAGGGSFTSSTVDGNTAPTGGGILLFGSQIGAAPVTVERAAWGARAALGARAATLPPSYSIVNSTISNNIATAGAGGGIANLFFVLRLQNDTVADNLSTAPGSQLYTLNIIQAVTKPRNTIVSGSSTANCAVGAVMTQGHNIDSGVTCKFAASESNINPLLAALTLNAPGVTRTRAIAPPSLAVDRGDNAGCPSTDQRGVVRLAPGDPTCDIGAYEFRATPPPSPTPTVPPTLPKAGNGLAGTPVELVAWLLLGGVAVAGTAVMTRVRLRA